MKDYCCKNGWLLEGALIRILNLLGTVKLLPGIRCWCFTFHSAKRQFQLNISRYCCQSLLATATRFNNSVGADIWRCMSSFILINKNKEKSWDPLEKTTHFFVNTRYWLSDYYPKSYQPDSKGRSTLAFVIRLGPIIVGQLKNPFEYPGTFLTKALNIVIKTIAINSLRYKRSLLS